MAEMIPAAHRGWLLVALGGVGTAFGYLVASGAAAILEPLFSWRILWMLGLPTGIAVIILNRYIPESPQFLANVGLWNQAKAVLRKYNGELDDGGDQPAESEQVADKQGLYDTLSGAYGKITLGLIGTGVSWGIVSFGFLLQFPESCLWSGFITTGAASNRWLCL